MSADHINALCSKEKEIVWTGRKEGQGRLIYSGKLGSRNTTFILRDLNSI